MNTLLDLHLATGEIEEINDERRSGYEWERRFPSVVRALARHDGWIAGGTAGLRELDRAFAAARSPSRTLSAWRGGAG